MSTIKTLQQFNQQYELTKHLGEGGYGTVYVCKELATGTLRAVKTMEDWKCNNRTRCPRRMQTIPNEILLWEPLSHSNIHSLLDVFFDETTERWFLVMEYDPGFQDLFDHVDKVGALSSADSSNLIRQLVRVIYYLALEGVDHRDLKDENILYNPLTKQIKLIDFGSAAQLKSDPYESFRGTDVYIPPEYYTTGQYCAFPAAVWAVGCLSYILLSGDCPFQSRAAVTEFKKLTDLNAAYGERSGRLDFIRCCLNPDHFQRALLSDLLAHPWLAIA
jgi:serine/threonine protein kinase